MIIDSSTQCQDGLTTCQCQLTYIIYYTTYHLYTYYIKLLTVVTICNTDIITRRNVDLIPKVTEDNSYSKFTRRFKN